MHIILSPAKTLDYTSTLPVSEYSIPRFGDASEYLIKKLQRKSPKDLQKLMGISESLARLNKERYHDWSRPFTPDKARPAIFAFKGDVYVGLEAYELSKSDITYAQKHVSILSGLYGLLRPLDLILPYRLEMGTKLGLTKTKTNLYKFWNKDLRKQLEQDMKESNDMVFLNLASQEYFKAVDVAPWKMPVISPQFKEERPEGFKMISFFAKKARGLMATYVIKNRLSHPEELKNFDSEGYVFNEKLSDTAKNKWVFTRKS